MTEDLVRGKIYMKYIIDKNYCTKCDLLKPL